MAKRKSNGSLCEEKGFKVTSGAVEEKYTFDWKIENFMVIKSFYEFSDQQKFQFEAGASIGTRTEWGFSLQEHPDTKDIGIFLKLSKAPPNLVAIANFSVETVKPNGELCNKETVTSTPYTLKSRAWGLGYFFGDDNSEELKEQIWEDGSIVIRLNLKLFLLKRGAAVKPNVEEEVNRFEKGELQKLRDSMTGMLKPGSQLKVGMIIKVVSKDGVEFDVKTDVLSARSPVLKVMFDNGTWKEGRSSRRRGRSGAGGSWVLEDLSGKTVKVLLHYLIGGVLLKEDWKEEDVILELTYAADKYQLEGLTEFLDKVLPAIPYGMETLAKLTLLTKRLGMKNAEKELFAKLKESATDIEQLMFDKEGCLLGKD